MTVQQQFRDAFYNRLSTWNDFSPAQLSLLADCALAQASFESADFSSSVYAADNNAIGYKYYAGSKWQSGAGLQSPEGDNYASYASIVDCANELADWIHRRAVDFQDVNSVEGYADTMVQDGYAGATPQAYESGLLSYYSPSPAQGLSNTPPLLPSKLAGFVNGNSPFSWIMIGLLVIFWFNRKRFFK